ncbi:hypothetical protein Bca101_016963 [Brassica carinata]
MEEPNISQLPDDLILKIFSFLPLYEESVATRLLTNEDPWKLELLPVVVLYLVLGRNYPASDINFWVKLAVKRSVRKLRITMIKVVPSCFRLPSLKSLHLFWFKFSDNESVASLLQSCPDLEYLVVKDVMFKTLPPWFLMSSLKSLVVKDVMFKTLPPWFLMSSLKILHLVSSSFSDDQSVASLLQKCPVLEDLVVKKTQVFDSNKCTLSSCTTLKTLTLSKLSIKVALPWSRLPLLKTLHLISVKFSSDESIASFLPICPVLECLVVDRSKADNAMFKDVPHWFCLPSLKSLHLLSVKFSMDESVAKLIQRCPVLEDLVMNNTTDDNVMIFNINSPSLRSLSIVNSKGKRAYVKENHGFVINAPSLEKMNFKDTFSNFLVFEHMPEVIEANIQAICAQSNTFVGSLTSIRYLSLCSLSSETPYPSGTTFPFLGYLELCTCSAGWANLLVCILKDAPTLNYLKLKSQHGAYYKDPMLL